MGTCLSKKKNTTPAANTPPQLHHETDNTEIFIIKHPQTHQNPNQISAMANGGDIVRTPSRTKQELDAILVQCGRLSRSTSTPRRVRRRSGSKGSFDFDLESGSKNGDDEAHHTPRKHGPRVSSPSSRRSSRERRVSVSPNRRSEPPFPPNSGGGGDGNNRPGKMVSVPATDKSNNAGGGDAVVSGGGSGGVRRIHVRRNVGVAAVRSRSPARANLRVFDENQNGEQTWQKPLLLSRSNSRKTEHSPYRRDPLAEIDNKAQMHMTNTEKINKNSFVTKQIVGEAEMDMDMDMDMNPETLPNRNPPSYASLLLEDIHNFHQKNTATDTAPPPTFTLPACLSKAYLILEAVAELNSTKSANNQSSSFLEERRKTLTAAATTTKTTGNRVNKVNLVDSDTVDSGELMKLATFSSSSRSNVQENRLGTT